MGEIEQLADDLGQIIFRLETNFDTFRATEKAETRAACGEAVLTDIEGLKGLKARILSNQGLEILALRAYPNLKACGACSRHRDSGHWECETCYPDMNELLDAHMEVQENLYQELLRMSGLSDPLNGRIGTNHILAALRRKLGQEPLDGWHRFMETWTRVNRLSVVFFAGAVFAILLMLACYLITGGT